MPDELPGASDSWGNKLDTNRDFSEGEPKYQKIREAILSAICSVFDAENLDGIPAQSREFVSAFADVLSSDASQSIEDMLEVMRQRYGSEAVLSSLAGIDIDIPEILAHINRERMKRLLGDN